jgi:hypothetical protein
MMTMKEKKKKKKMMMMVVVVVVMIKTRVAMRPRDPTRPRRRTA